jgi:nucleotidyltransferase/DNA polymerase involved in DNA repair
VDVNGAGRFSSFVSASNYITTIDQRIKENVHEASLDECLRLIHAVHPKTYTRLDMGGAPRIGYIAQDFDRELTGGYRCIMGASEDENRPLLAMDYSRIVPVLHGALLALMARVEVLESRV